MKVAHKGALRYNNGWLRSGALVILAVALAAARPAAAAEFRTPLGHEAFFGVVRAAVPPRANTAELYVGDERVARGRVSGGRVAFRIPRPPGRYDVRIRFERDGALVRRDEAREVWLLGRAHTRARRERASDRGLAASLGALARRYPGWAGLWVHDLSSGRTAGWNSDASFPAASTLKLGVLVAALDRFGPRPERSAAWRDIRDLATWSSNLAANRLLVRLGGSEAGGTAIVNRTLQRLGATSSWFTGNYRLNTGPLAPLGDAPKPLPVLTFRRTTAHDLGRILFELHANALGNRLAARRTGLDRHEARIALGLLLSAGGGDNAGLLRQALPPAVPVARKEGWTTQLRHTAGIVYGRGGPVIVVVLTFRPGAVDERASRALGRRVLRAAGLATPDR